MSFRRRLQMSEPVHYINVHAANTNLVGRSILGNTEYSTQIVCDEGYSIYEITIKMGGVDITSTAYDPTYNMISIASVTGDVDIECYAMHTMPSGYIRVDGIKNPSNAYIDTGYTLSYKNIATIDFTLLGGGDGYIIGSKLSTTAGTQGTVLRIYTGYSNLWYDPSTKGITEMTGINTVGRNSVVFDHYHGKVYGNGTLKMTYSKANNTDAAVACLFNCSPSSTQQSANMIINSCYIYDATTNTYERYYIPCLNDSGVAGFWDAARGVFQGSSNSTAFEATIEGAVVNPTLPTGYTLLKGCKNPRYAYFDTGYKPNKNTVISVEALLQGTPYLVASKSTGNSSMYGTGFVYDGGVLKAFINSNFSSTSYTTLGKRVRLKEDNANGKVYVDGRLTNSFTRTNVSDNKNLYAFAYPVGDAPRSANTIIYWIIIKEGDEFKRVYVAARNSSNQVGFYDTVNDTFTVSAAGTGTNAPFVAVEYGT